MYAALRVASHVDYRLVRSFVSSFVRVQDKKVFTVSGPYPSLRAALRRRGWVEKINNASSLTEATRLSANGKLLKLVFHGEVCMLVSVVNSQLCEN